MAGSAAVQSAARTARMRESKCNLQDSWTQELDLRPWTKTF